MSQHHNPRMALTPAMRGVLERMARAGNPPLHALTPAQARAFYALGSGVLDIAPHALARVQTLSVPVRDGAALHARLVAPSHERLPVLLYFHGGGFMIGSVDTHDALCRTLAQRAHCAVVSLDYRLAPEHPFPAAHHDAWDALAWLAGQGDALGLDTARLAVGGDSAGGTLAAACALAARLQGPALALQLLIYPGLAARQDTPSHQRYAKGFVLEAEGIRWFYSHCLHDLAAREDPRFAPLNAPDLEGVAPAWIGLAECDPLVDEGVMYADRLRLAGVPVDLEIYRGVTHEFIKMGRVIAQALQAHADAARALRHAFGGPLAPPL